MSVTYTALYKGEVILRFDSLWHMYTVTDNKNGKLDAPVTAVSTVLGIIDKSQQLVPWAINETINYLKANLKAGVVYTDTEISTMLSIAKRASTSKKTNAGDFGTSLHRWVESYARKENPAMPAEAMLRRSVEQFLKWVYETGVEFVLNEQPLYSRKYGCSGTLDTIAKIDGKLYIGDWKTSSRIYLSQKIQTAGYRMMRNEEYPEEKYAGQFIIRFGKDGKFEKKFIDKPEENKKLEKMFIHFLKAGDIYRAMESK